MARRKPVECTVFGKAQFAVVDSPLWRNQTDPIVTIAKTSKGRTDLLMGWAPVTGIAVNAGVDASVFKGLSGNYIVTSFGDKASTITLSGVTFAGGVNLECVDKAKSNTSIQDFYNKYKLGADKVKFNRLTFNDPFSDNKVVGGTTGFGSGPDKYKFNTARDKENRLYVVVEDNDSMRTYECVLIGMRTLAESNKDTMGKMFEYTFQFIGVQI